ncbi:MAG: hypothetical protein JWO95_1606 [Verrucomicrobiales bacterium]|nr:hypothetical protein [Verrucomicrobiales bacterium]
MKYLARVKQVLMPGTHAWARRVSNGKVQYDGMPNPDYVFIECGSEQNPSCQMHRYKDDGTFCGDTWHEDIAQAKQRAKDEYGIADGDWSIQKDA